jgi:hypothetical protein
MCTSLYKTDKDEAWDGHGNKSLAGSLVSSLHRLKDVDNKGNHTETAMVPLLDNTERDLICLQMADSSYLEISQSRSRELFDYTLAYSTCISRYNLDTP